MNNFCVQCGTKNASDAKYCKSCGTKLTSIEPNNSVKLSNENRVSTTTKGTNKKSTILKYTYEILIFISAAFIAVIVQMTLFGFGIMAEINNPGAFLFIGIWMLLRGIFLKKGKSKTWGYWLLGLYVVILIAYSTFLHSSSGISWQIDKLKKEVPITLDEQTEISNIMIIGDKELQVNYRMYNVSPETLKEYESKLTFVIIKETCTNNMFRNLINNKWAVITKIEDRDYNEMKRGKVTKSLCKKLRK